MATVTGTFTGTGQSAVLRGTKTVDVSLSGAASATVAIQRRVGSAWVTIESITGDGERVVENATALEMRLNCTAYTSGTVTYTMTSN